MSGSFSILSGQCSYEQLGTWYAWLWESAGLQGHRWWEFHQEEESQQVRSVPEQPLQQRATGHIVAAAGLTLAW